MILQAAGLALLASLSPTPLLLAAAYLGSERPRFTASVFLLGAVAVSLLMGVVVLVVLRAAHLNVPTQHAPRYGLRLGLGVVLVAAGLVAARRRPRPPDPAKPQQGLVSRMIANPTPRSAFVAGVVVFASGLSFLAAVQVIGTSRDGPGLTIAALIIVIAVYALPAWLPIALHVAAPGVTTRSLTAFNGWLRGHGRAIAVWAMAVVGAILIGDGIYGLAEVR